MFECGVVFIAGGCQAEANEVPRALQSRASAQFAGGSDAVSIRGVAPREGEYIAEARTPESLDRASGVREYRVNSGGKDLHCPETLVSFVPDNGSGSGVEPLSVIFHSGSRSSEPFSFT
jgi:hypothetical protein